MDHRRTLEARQTFTVNAGGPEQWEFSTADKIGHGSFGSIYLGAHHRVCTRVFFS